MGIRRYTIAGLGDLIFTGITDRFVDVENPRLSKNEWGVDVVERTISGIQPLLPAVEAGLKQGQVYRHNGANFYLQTWQTDNSAIFPRISLIYKGFANGAAPDPVPSNDVIEQQISLAVQADNTNFGLSYEVASATREIRYQCPQTVWRYITRTKPGVFGGGIDAGGAPFILHSVIKVQKKEGGDVIFAGSDAPAALVTALTPAIFKNIVGPRSAPIIGTPYYENEATVCSMFAGS